MTREEQIKEIVHLAGQRTREDRMNEIFNSDKSDEQKIIAYQQVVIEELSEQVGNSNKLLVAALNKKIEEVSQ